MKTNLKKAFLITTTIALLLLPTVSVDCDRSLLQTFQLKGLRYSLQDRMEICPTVHDTCCSIMDQIYIVKYWNDYSFPVLRDYNANMFGMFGRIADFHILFSKIPREDITVHYVNHRWIPYLHRLCGDTSPGSQVESTEKEDIILLNKIFPGSGKIARLTPEDVPNPIAIDLRNTMVDKATISVYLALISLTLTDQFDYRVPLQALIGLESDIDTMDFRTKLMSKFNFNQLKWNFINQVKRAKKEIEKNYKQLISKFETIPMMKEQLEVIHETYTAKFVKFLSKIEDFMTKYNSIGNPYKKHKLISRFSVQLQVDLMDVLGYITKAKFELDQEENAITEKIYGNMERGKLDSEKGVTEKQVVEAIAKTNFLKKENVKEKKQFVREKLYDSVNDLSVNANVENMGDQLKTEWKKTENNDNLLPIDTEDFTPYYDLFKPNPAIKNKEPTDVPEGYIHPPYDPYDTLLTEPSDYAVQFTVLNAMNGAKDAAEYGKHAVKSAKAMIEHYKKLGLNTKALFEKGFNQLKGGVIKSANDIQKGVVKGFKDSAKFLHGGVQKFKGGVLAIGKGFKRGGAVLKKGILNTFKGLGSFIGRKIARMKAFVSGVVKEIKRLVALEIQKTKVMLKLIKAHLPLDILVITEAFLHKLLFMFNLTGWTKFFNQNTADMMKLYKLKEVPYKYPFVPKTIDPKYKKSLKYYFSELDRKILEPHVDKKLFNPKIVSPIPIDKLKSVECRIMGRFIFKNIVINNKYKMKFCYDVYEKFNSFDIEAYKKMLTVFKRENMLMLEMKKTLYCGICDATKQTSFSHDKQLMVFEEEFCQEMLMRFDGYLMWKNLLLIEYMDQFVELINCYETPGNHYDYPVSSFLEKYKHKIWLVKKCMDRREQKDFMMYCHFICTQFKYKGISVFFDGDEKLVNLFMFKIFNFGRKIGIRPLPLIKVIPTIKEKEVNRDFAPPQKPEPSTAAPLNAFQIMEQKINGVYSDIVNNYTRTKYQYSREVPKKRKYMTPQKTPLDNMKPLKTKKSKKSKKKRKRKKRIKDKMIRKYADILEGDKVNQLNRQHFTAVKKAKNKVKKDVPAGFYNIVPKHIYEKKVIAVQNKRPRKLIKDKLTKQTKNKQKIKKVTPKNLSAVMEIIRDQQKQINEEMNKPKERQLSMGNPALKKNKFKRKPSDIIDSQIFERKARIYPIDCYRTFYSRNVPALNPIVMNDLANFNLNSITNLLEIKYKKQHPETFSAPAIMNYLQANKDVVDGFNDDLGTVNFLDIDHNGNIKKPKKREGNHLKKRKKKVKGSPADEITEDVKEYAFAEKYSEYGKSYPSHENLFVHMLHNKHLYDTKEEEDN